MPSEIGRLGAKGRLSDEIIQPIPKKIAFQRLSFRIEAWMEVFVFH